MANNDSFCHDFFLLLTRMLLSRATVKPSIIVVEFQTQYLMTPNVGVYIVLNTSRERIVTHCIRLKLSAKDKHWNVHTYPC